MKKVIILSLLIMILLLGCNDVNPSDTESENMEASDVIINTYYEEPLSLANDETIILKGLSDGEFVEVIVKGEISDFELIELKWDEEKNDVVEAGVIHSLNQIKDKTIVIKTYAPEGIPFEKIKWKTLDGEIHEYIIAEYNLRGE